MKDKLMYLFDRLEEHALLNIDQCEFKYDCEGYGFILKTAGNEICHCYGGDYHIKIYQRDKNNFKVVECCVIQDNGSMDFKDIDNRIKNLKSNIIHATMNQMYFFTENFKTALDDVLSSFSIYKIWAK